MKTKNNHPAETDLHLLQEHIENQKIASLPLCDIKGNIVVIDCLSDVSQAVEQLMRCDLIGFDTETRPSFKRGVTHKISLMQLADETTCFLFRLHKIGHSPELKALLESDLHKKVGLSVHDDFLSLNGWMDVKPRNFVELQKYVKAFGIEEMGLQKIYAIIFGQKISKRQQLSNWEADTLTPAQQQYAATDAWACRNIYKELQNRFVNNHK